MKRSFILGLIVATGMLIAGPTPRATAARFFRTPFHPTHNPFMHPNFQQSMPRMYMPNMYSPRYHHNNYRRNNGKRYNKNGQKQMSPTDWVIANLKVAQTDLQKKNTSDASLQLMGSENILNGLVKNQKKANKDTETNIDIALRSVKDARKSLHYRKLDESEVGISAALTALTGKNNNNQNNNKKPAPKAPVKKKN